MIDRHDIFDRDAVADLEAWGGALTLRGIALSQVAEDLSVDVRQRSRARWWFYAAHVVAGSRVESRLPNVALGHEEARDPAQPLLEVAKLEVVEWVHAFRAHAQVPPGPVVFERGRKPRQVVAR